MSKVNRVPGTNRQSVTAADGTTMQRSYVYLPAHIWRLLQESARNTGTSVSKTIQAFATSGLPNSKDQNERTDTSST